MKKFLALLLSVVMVLALCAGSAFAEGTDYDVENRTYDGVTITIHTRWDEADTSGPLYQWIVDSFMEKYPGITVEAIKIPTESEWLQSESVLMSDKASMPNIIVEYGGSRMLSYIQEGLIVNMDPYFEQYPDWPSRFNSLGKDMVDYTSYGIEGTYGCGFTGYEVMLFYNEDILAENDIDPASIQSWDDLMDACAKLKANGVQPFEMGEQDDYRFGHLHTALNYKTYGCQIAVPLGTREVAYDGEEQKAIYQMIIDAYNEGYLGTNLLGTDDGQERALFNTGKTAFLFMGTWYCAEDHKDDIVAAGKVHPLRMPYVNEEYKYNDMGGGNEAYYVVDTGDPDEVAASVLFLKYMTSEEVVNHFYEGYPAPMSVVVTTDSDVNYLASEAMAVLNESEVVAGDIENYDIASHMINTVRQALQQIPMGADADTIGETIVDLISEYE